jgi:IclR family acetate operon transcriptional repressor
MPDGSQVRDALAILRGFDQGLAEVSVPEIALRTGLDPSTVSDSVATLLDEGFLARATDGRYRLGSVLVILGRRIEEATGLGEAEDLLKQLTVRTGESSSLAVRSGRDVVVLVLAPSPQRLRVEHGVGSRLPAHASAMGKALLAFGYDDPEAAANELGELEQFTNHTIADTAALAAELRAVRSTGYATNREERYDGVVGVAAPVIVPGRGAVAAVGVQGPAARLRDPDDRSLTRLVERTAQSVARCLAAGSPLPIQTADPARRPKNVPSPRLIPLT